MIHRSDEGGHLVLALGKATSDIGIQIAAGIGFTVQAHKECKLGGVCGSGLVE